MNSFEPVANNDIECDTKAVVLVLDDDAQSRFSCQLMLDQCGYRVLQAATTDEAVQLLLKNTVHVMVLDKDLLLNEGDKKNGIDEIPNLLTLQPHLQVLMHSASNCIKDVVEAMRLGASGYLTKANYTPDLFREQISKSVTYARLKLNELQSKRDSNSNGDIVVLSGSSRIVRLMKNHLSAVAHSPAAILLLGETGTGKTTIARHIHDLRKEFLNQDDRPFLALNMASLPANLAERELFGHDKGSFTGAEDSKPGIFELVNGGTLFLDEIGDAPAELQTKLLKVIEEGKFTRIGSPDKVREVKFKLICATHRDLEQMVDDGRFREDLYTRISTFPVRVPSLLERTEDIPEIIKLITPKIASENKVIFTYDDLPKDYIDHVMRNPIRGNIRGLIQQLTRLVVYLPKNKKGTPVFKEWHKILNSDHAHGPTAKSLDRITLDDIRTAPFEVLGAGFPGYYEMMQELENKILDEAISKYHTQSDVARALGISKAKVNGYMVKRNGRTRRMGKKKSRIAQLARA